MWDWLRIICEMGGELIIQFVYKIEEGHKLWIVAWILFRDDFILINLESDRVISLVMFICFGSDILEGTDGSSTYLRSGINKSAITL